MVMMSEVSMVFDGDEMAGLLALDQKMIKSAEVQRPHYGIHDMVRLKQFKKAVSLPDVTESILSNWINS